MSTEYEFKNEFDKNKELTNAIGQVGVGIKRGRKLGSKPSICSVCGNKKVWKCQICP